MTTFFFLASWWPGADDVTQYLQYCLICSSCQSDLHQCTRAHTRAHTPIHLPHCQSKLGACSLNPIYGSPIVFLDAVSDTGKKGQNSSSHHSGRGQEKIYVYLKPRERDRDGQTAQRRRKGWNRLAGIEKRQMDGETERVRRWDKHTDRQRDRLHAMNSAVTPPTFFASASCHSQLMTAPILSLPPSPQSHEDLLLSSHSEHHIKLVHRNVCVNARVYLIGYVTPCWGRNASVYVCVCAQMPDCVSAIWQASLFQKSLSDCGSIWQAPILRKACGLGWANKYTRRKSPLLTTGQKTLQTQGCVEYRS